MTLPSPLRSFPIFSLQSFSLSAFLLPALASVSAFAALRVDLNPVSDRKDILSPRCENWTIAEAPEASQTFGTVSIRFRAVSSVGKGLGAGLYMAALDTQATLAADGLFVKDANAGGSIEMILSGLTPGKHSITTFHNSLWTDPLSSFSVSVDGKPVLNGVKPSTRTDNDEDMSSAYVEVDAVAGKDVVLLYKPDGSAKIDNIVINAFEIDGVNPEKVASKPYPADEDEHAPENPVLTWRPAKGAIGHQLYLGTSADAVSKATPGSPEFKGTFGLTKYSAKNLSHMTDTFWRVDEVFADKSKTKGTVWRLRVRHLAFQGAEGYGRFAIGGRGGRVIEVTTLDDSGPGSLREAIDAMGPRTVVFRVGGVIKLKSKLIIKNPYITIAGQTAPGDGIAVHHFTFGAYGSHDVIIRYVRIRVGDESGKTLDGAGLGACNHSIMDHCSIAWSIDEGFSSHGAKNITLQRSIIGEALNMSVHSHYVGSGKGHSFAGSVSGDIGSLHHNLLANNSGPNWSLAGGLNQAAKFAGRLDLRNNVIYNWGHRTNDGGAKAVNLVGNYFIPGAASKVFHILMPDFGSRSDPQQYYMADNVMEGHPEYSPDNWANGGSQLQPSELKKVGVNESEALALIRLNRPFCESGITVHSAQQAYESVLADVGANFPKYDSVDERILSDVLKRKTTAKGSKTGTPGIIDSQNDAGGYPVMKGGQAPVDSDQDGLPDAWESARGLNPKDAADSAKEAINGRGYTNLEVYLNTLGRIW